MQEVTPRSTREEDFVGLREHVKELKNKYVMAQQYETASILRDMERLSMDLIELVPSVNQPLLDLEKKLEELYVKVIQKYGIQPQSPNTSSEG